MNELIQWEQHRYALISLLQYVENEKKLERLKILLEEAIKIAFEQIKKIEYRMELED